MMNILVTAAALIFTITIHELAHGYVALFNGDQTAKNHGRLTFNPLAHLDPKGLLFLLVFRFGWAKPVPINPNNFKNRKLGLFLVSIAGVLVNFISSFISIGILILIKPSSPLLIKLFEELAIYGVFFGVFNLIPIPPLDGSKILASFFSIRFEYFIYKYERYFNILLIILLFTNQISRFMLPLVNYILNYFQLFFIRLIL